jgi:hypothetical protein
VNAAPLPSAATPHPRAMPPMQAPGFGRTVFGPFADPRTYGNFAYLMLGLPLATAWFSYVVTMLATSAGLLVTLLGLPLLGLTLVTSRALASLDCRLTKALLGVEMPRVVALRPRGDGFWRTVKVRLFDREAWTDCLYLLLRFPLAVFTFTVAISFVASALWMITLPLLVAAGVRSDYGRWHLDSVPRAFIFVVPGIVLFFVSLHVINLLADLSARFTRGMVGRVSQADLRRNVARLLSHDRRLDGATILRELELYHGYSADYTITKVYAALIGLEDLGLVQVEVIDGAAIYSLTQPGEDALAASRGA